MPEHRIWVTHKYGQDLIYQSLNGIEAEKELKRLKEQSSNTGETYRMDIIHWS